MELMYKGESRSVEDIRREFLPVKEDGSPLPVREVAEKIAEWSVFFFGDADQPGHYHIRGEVPEFHKQIYEDLAVGTRLYYISAPSEFSKTTICTLIYPLYRTVYYHEPYIVLSSRVDDTAMEMLDEIKNELRDNEKFKTVYGTLLPTPDEKPATRYKKKDSAHVIELENGTTIRSVGWGGNVRGRKRKGYRITLFIGDDPEEVEDMTSDVVLKKHIKWLKRSVVPRTDKEFGKVRIVGTRIGLGCTIDNLMKDPRWHGRVYKALIPDELPIEKRTSIWEKRWPTAWLQKERRDAIAAGDLDDWMFERMNEPVSSLVKNLKGYLTWEGEFERRNEQNLLHIHGYLDPISVYTYHTIDPAFSDAESADERAQVTFAMGYLPESWGKKPSIFVLEYDFDRKDPDVLIDRMLDLHRKYYYRNFMIETVAGQKIYEYLAIKALQKDPFMLKYPVGPIFVPYHSRSKEDRIYVYFKTVVKNKQLYIKTDMLELQQELDYFMQCSHLHLLDALEIGASKATVCNENIVNINKKSRHRGYEDGLEEELAKQGKQYLLW